MQNSNWKQYFDQKATTHGASVKSSDYYDDKSFYLQRDNILQWLGDIKGNVILDAGCGVGAFTEPLASDNDVYGVDFSAKSLEFAAKRGLKACQGDLMALTFEDDFFDLVLCIGVIQLIPDYVGVINELARVVKPGGTLLVQTLHRGSIQRKLLRLIEKDKKFDRMYSINELEDVYRICGVGENIEFMKMFHPFSYVSHGKTGDTPSNIFCTSFAIKGQKKRG